MELDEAIKHCEEVAEERQKKADMFKSLKDFDNPKSTIKHGYENCLECASEHRQLAEWLKKLKAYEEAREEIIRKRDSGQWSETVVFGFNRAIRIIDKHLKEVNADEDSDCMD